MKLIKRGSERWSMVIPMENNGWWGGQVTTMSTSTNVDRSILRVLSSSTKIIFDYVVRLICTHNIIIKLKDEDQVTPRIILKKLFFRTIYFLKSKN